MNYSSSGIIGSLFTLVMIQPDKLIEAVVYGFAGAVGALIARFFWGLAERLINSKKNSKEK